jgi:hypothetical protein
MESRPRRGPHPKSSHARSPHPRPPADRTHPHRLNRKDQHSTHPRIPHPRPDPCPGSAGTPRPTADLAAQLFGRANRLSAVASARRWIPVSREKEQDKEPSPAPAQVRGHPTSSSSLSSSRSSSLTPHRDDQPKTLLWTRSLIAEISVPTRLRPRIAPVPSGVTDPGYSGSIPRRILSSPYGLTAAATCRCPRSCGRQTVAKVPRHYHRGSVQLFGKARRLSAASARRRIPAEP